MNRAISYYVIAALTAFLFNVSVTDAAVQYEQKDSTAIEEFSIYYKCDSINVNPHYLDNEEQISRILHYIRNSPRIDSITIYSYSSPEGRYAHNRYLAKERGKAAMRFLLSHSPDSLKLDAGKIKLSPIAENWEGLISLVSENYDRDDRELVLEILNDDTIDDDVRKTRLQRLDNGRSWRYIIDNYMPGLRSASWICVWAEVIPPLPCSNAPEDNLVARGSIATPPLRSDAPVTDDGDRTIFALKTNLLYDAVTALNFAVEIPFNEHLSVLYEHHCPWWLSKNNKYCMQFLSYGGEFRWWFLPRTRPETADRKLRDALMGHFIGINCWGGKADLQWGRDFGCYQFDFISAGLSYGYSMPISKHLNLEFSISAGYARIPYQHYIPTDDWQILIKDKNNAGTLHYFGPTKAEISLVIPIYASFFRKGGAR